MKALLLKLWWSSTQRVMSLTFGGKLVALLADVLIAARLGTGEASDALFVALGFPLYVDTVTRQSAKYSLVPIFIDYRVEKPEEYHRFVSGLINVALVGGLVLLALALVASPWIVRVLGPGMTAEGTAQATRLLRTCAPMLFFAPAITLQGVLLNSEKLFSRVALRNAVAPMAVSITLLATWGLSNAALWAAAAYSMGFAAYFGVLVDGVRRRAAFEYRLFAWPRSKDLVEVRSALSWPSMGFVVRQGARLLERSIASLVAVGGVSAYYFSYRIFSGIQTVIGSSIATTGLPDLSEKNAAEGRLEEVWTTVWKQVAQTALLALPASVVILFFNGPIIDIVFGRGAFDAEAVRQTKRLLAWFAPAVLFTCLVPPLTSVLYSMKKYQYVFTNMLGMATLNIGLAWVLTQNAKLGLEGISISVSLTALCSVVTLTMLVHKAGLPLLGSTIQEINR